MLKILETARRKRGGKPKALLEGIKKVSMDEGNEVRANTEKVSAENFAAEKEEHQTPPKELLEKEFQIRHSIFDYNPEPDSSSEPGTNKVVLFENSSPDYEAPGSPENIPPQNDMETEDAETAQRFKCSICGFISEGIIYQLFEHLEEEHGMEDEEEELEKYCIPIRNEQEEVGPEKEGSAVSKNAGEGPEAQSGTCEETENEVIFDGNPEPDSSKQPGTEEVVLFENYEDYLASVAGEAQRESELDTASSGSVAKVESRDEPASAEVALLKEQLELSEGVLKQREIKHNEDIKFYEKKLQMKDCEIVRLKKTEEASRMRHQAEMRKNEELRTQANAQDNEMLKLQSRLAREKREKDDAIKKLAAIKSLHSSISSILSNSEGSDIKSKSEYVEKFEDDEGVSAGVKREAASSEPSSPSLKRRKMMSPKKNNDHEAAMKVSEEREGEKQGKQIIGEEEKGEKSKNH